MAYPDPVSPLVEQLVSLREASAAFDLAPEEAATSAAVARSLRRTLAVVLQYESPRDVGSAGFLLVTDREGNPTLRFRSDVLPSSPGFIEELWKVAGAALAPDQAILLDPALGRAIAEEALARNGAEERRLRDEKRRLLAACLLGDPEAQWPRGCPHPLGCCRSGSAA
jgi:hypothetical protein